MASDAAGGGGGGGRSSFAVIELHQLNQRIFFPLSALGSLLVQVGTYPLIVVRTRLQLQAGSSAYSGMADCFRSVLAHEGVRGLYAGFWVRNFQALSSVLYAYTYETVRSETKQLAPSVRSFLGGGCASAVSQTLLVPVDIVSQHLMVLSRQQQQQQQQQQQRHQLTPLSLTPEEQRSAASRAAGVVRGVYRRHGLSGFYRGYLVSLAHFVPNSALWWAFYNTYCEMASRLLASSSSSSSSAYDDDNNARSRRLPVQLASAPLAGMSSGLITNPVDVVRVRMQVGGRPLGDTLRRLWREEGVAFAWKGLTARLAQSAFFSFFIILSYEPIKRFSLKEEYRASISW